MDRYRANRFQVFLSLPSHTRSFVRLALFFAEFRHRIRRDSQRAVVAITGISCFYCFGLFHYGVGGIIICVKFLVSHSLRLICLIMIPRPRFLWSIPEQPNGGGEHLVIRISGIGGQWLLSGYCLFILFTKVFLFNMMRILMKGSQLITCESNVTIFCGGCREGIARAHAKREGSIRGGGGGLEAEDTMSK